jgi:lipopolysaccharide export system permease protein
MLNFLKFRRQKNKPQTALPLHQGVFDRSLMREFASTGLFVFTILLAIIALTQVIRLLGESVGGALPVESLLILLGFGALNYLPILLSVSLFLSVLLTLTRSYGDSEMVVWFSSGASLLRWIRPVLLYAIPVVLMIALLSLVLAPWAKSKVSDIRAKLESRDDVAVSTPGVFRESNQADRVFFLEKVGEDNTHVSNIFVQSVRQGQVATMVAKDGLQEIQANGDKFIILLNGTRHEGTPGQLDYKIVEFERYAMRIGAVENKKPFTNFKTATTLFLWQNPSTYNTAELNARIGAPISALIVVLLAIPLSFVNPRVGRSLNMFGAILIYMLYSNLINIVNSWVGQGKVADSAGLWGVHGLMLAVMMLLFYYRLLVFSVRRLMP